MLNEKQKENIDRAVKLEDTSWLSGLIQQIHKELSLEEKEDNRVFDPDAKTHGILCEICDALVRHDAANVFTNLNIKYEGKISIPNLPAPNGRRIVDWATENKALSLIDSIERAGGVSFPVILRTDEAQTYFNRWLNSLDKHPVAWFIANLMHLGARKEAEWNDIENIVEAMVARSILSKDFETCQTALDEFWDYFNGSVESFKALLILSQKEQTYEISRLIHEFIVEFESQAPLPISPTTEPKTLHL